MDLGLGRMDRGDHEGGAGYREEIMSTHGAQRGAHWGAGMEHRGVHRGAGMGHTSGRTAGMGHRGGHTGEQHRGAGRQFSSIFA